MFVFNLHNKLYTPTERKNVNSTVLLLSFLNTFRLIMQIGRLAWRILQLFLSSVDWVLWCYHFLPPVRSFCVEFMTPSEEQLVLAIKKLNHITMTILHPIFAYYTIHKLPHWIKKRSASEVNQIKSMLKWTANKLHEWDSHWSLVCNYSLTTNGLFHEFPDRDT